MQWYYAVGDERIGPVDHATFVQAAAAGKIGPETLVWNEELPEWTPYGQVQAARAMVSYERCSECGNTFSTSDMIKHRDVWVCAGCKPQFLQKFREGVQVGSQYVYAGFGIRLLARIVDSLITGVASIIIAIPLALGIGVLLKDADPMTMFAVSQVVINIALYGCQCAYEVFFLHRYGATPGKMVCGLKVIAADGNYVSYGRGIGRYFAYMLSALTLFIGYLMIIFDEEKRSLHDRICATHVIKVK